MITADEIKKIATDVDLPFVAEADTIAVKYHDLCTAIAERWGRHDLNWCGFGQWSSKAIGVSLRLNNSSPFWTRVHRAFSIPRIFGGVTRAVVRFLLGSAYSKGLTIANRSIFLEIGTFHTSLLTQETGLTILQADPGLLWSKDLPPLLNEVPEEYLRTAARLLRQAERESLDARSDLMLGANIALSSYEQLRVQPALELVFYRPARWITRVSWRLPYYIITRAPFSRYAIYTEPHDAQPRFAKWLESRWVGLFSRLLLLDIPLGHINLGTDLTVEPGHTPPLLEAKLRPDVQELVAKFHKPGGSPPLSGVANWLNYEDRMRFIISYFMIYQNEASMFDYPFPKKRRRPAKERHHIPAAITRLFRINDPALKALQDLTIQPQSVVLIEAEH